ncbi:MAG: sulfotransferase [Steroidobacteraceae bacterium]
MTLESLRPEVVLGAAVEHTGLTDFGGRSFTAGLSIYLDDLRGEARLNAAGIVGQFQDLVRLLSNRLRFQRDLKAHPEIRDEQIAKPIVILGLPRTGSSKLQRMIAADPDAQRLEVWRLLFPAPFSADANAGPDPRIKLAEQFESTLRAHEPEFMARHPMEAHEPDEEVWLIEMTHESPMSSLKTRAPAHRAFTEGRSQRGVYDYLRNLLQYLQWQDGGGRGRPWILKSPIHIGELPTLFATFPDAMVVHCHRNPRIAIPSYASLGEVAHVMHSDDVDLHELGHDANQFWARQIERNLTVRRELGEDRIVDVYYEYIRDRPLAVIEEIYARAGRAVTPAARYAFERYDAHRPQDFFGKHEYSKERYGLTDAHIEKAFANYLSRFPRVNANG